MTPLSKMKDFLGFGLNIVPSLRTWHYQNMWRMARDYAAPRPDGTVRSLPLSVGIYINGICNRNCDFCYYNWFDQDFVRRNISFSVFKDLLRLPVAKNAVRLTIAGGEPFLHPGLFDLVEEARRRGLYTTMHTNGTLLAKRADDLVRSPLNSINVSLYDDILDNTLEALGELLRELKLRGSTMRVSASRLVTRPRLGEMVAVLRQSRRYGVTNIFFQSYYTDKSEESGLRVVDDDDYRFHCREVIDFARRASMVVFLPPAMRPGSASENFCNSLLASMAFDEKGQISPCCMIAPPNGAFGSVFDDDPFNNEHYLHLRRAIHQGHGRRMAYCKNCYLLGSRGIKFF